MENFSIMSVFLLVDRAGADLGLLTGESRRFDTNTSISSMDPLFRICFSPTFIIISRKITNGDAKLFARIEGSKGCQNFFDQNLHTLVQGSLSKSLLNHRSASKGPPGTESSQIESMLTETLQTLLEKAKPYNEESNMKSAKICVPDFWRRGRRITRSKL